MTNSATKKTQNRMTYEIEETIRSATPIIPTAITTMKSMYSYTDSNIQSHSIFMQAKQSYTFRSSDEPETFISIQLLEVDVMLFEQTLKTHTNWVSTTVAAATAAENWNWKITSNKKCNTNKKWKLNWPSVLIQFRRQAATYESSRKELYIVVSYIYINIYIWMNGRREEQR